MPTFSFPARAFVIEGDPEAVQESGRAYGRFATTAGEAAADLRALNLGSWVGSEGDAFRARLGEIPPHLEVAHGAFAQVARALDGFADVLASAQGRMAGVRADAEQTFSSLARARADHPEAPVDRLEGAWDDQLTTAAGLRAQVLEAAKRAAVSIRAAGRSSPTADQSWLTDGWEDGRRWLSNRVDDLRNFVAEHAGGLRVLAKALRWVGMALVAVGAALAVLSLAAGVFSFGIGWLGEIPAGAVLGAGMVLWGAGDTLDTTVDWAEGRIGGRELAFRAGFSVATAFAGGLAVKFGGKVLDKLAPRVAEKLRRLIDDVVKPGLVDERGSVGVPGGGRLSDVDHSAVRGLVDRVASAATREQALDDLARTFEVAPKRFRDLATDPDRGGVITRNGAEEAAAILGAERRGLLPEGMVRSSRPGADYEVPQGTQWPGGSEWDVKSFYSTTPTGQSAFGLQTAVKKLRLELDAGQNILLNTVNMSPDDLDQLQRAVADNGWIDRVVFYP
jgi:hypothetical protein